MVSEASTGYICNLEIYCGQGKRLIDTVETLLNPYLNLWHHVYMDNYYNSVKTSEVLLKHKIRTCGTMRINRGFPECLKNVKLKPGQSIFRRKNDVLLQIWRSKRDVRMISTIHSSIILESGNIDWKTKLRIQKPQSIIEYNKYMKGVDRADQYLSYYSIIRRTKKWTKRAVMYLLNCALFNSYKVYKALNATKRLSYKQFLLNVAKYWIMTEISETDASFEEPRPSTSQLQRHVLKKDPPGRLSMDMKKHKAIKIVTGGKKKHPQRQCRVCSAHKTKGLTSYMCQFCDVPLHRGECFTKYHTVSKY